jgi:hypothetical protein
MSTHTLHAAAAWHVRIPQLLVSAGLGGAMLNITLLRECQLLLEPGVLVVLHDPVGLTGERVMAHVYREAAQCTSDHHEGNGAVRASLHWVVVRAPLSQLWTSLHTLQSRAWRRASTSLSPVVPPRAPRVAEPSPRAESAHVTGTGGAKASPPPALLLIGEADHHDAIAPHAGARLLARALRRRWAVLAVTREGPLGSIVAPSRSGVVDGAPRTPDTEWRRHVVCQSGMLRSVPAH